MKKLGLGLLLLFCSIGGAFVALVLFGRSLPDARPRATMAVAATGNAAGGQAASRAAPLEGNAPLAVPVAGVARSAIADSWGDPRENGLRMHHGTDIMAPGGTLVTAAAPGTVEKLFQSAAGGTTIYVRSPARLWTYYYAHLSGYAPGLQEGQVVKTGDPLGYVGDTGNAGTGNFHLHFGLTRTTPDQHWYQGDDVDPYPYLAGKASSR
ncbi:MAG: peptidase [Sphingomonas bacterium]|jgi:murein DD-endopeptidase MepM/ murein hydrolase activator NlpD|uniref:M23 family metallopeptidase n=1 Tax=Sphingomonas bacterium TaxID=1895847 RepID=UPI00260E8644|nr:M23 family metallopeptidase [Sphingomonas bacterium]MDB5704969.1 peptidase [Sphingomonas bacterium]